MAFRKHFSAPITEKSVSLQPCKNNIMMKKKKLPYIIGVLICFLALTLAAPSCSSSHQTTKKAPRYSRQRTKSPRWNASTSRTTTYYIKKHSTKQRHSPKPKKRH